MTEVLDVPLWALALGLLGLCAIAFTFGYATGALPSRRTFAVRLAAEFGVAFVVAAGLVLGTALGFTLLSLLV